MLLDTRGNSSITINPGFSQGWTSVDPERKPSVPTPKSENQSGKLIMAANALGNPIDIPPRSLEALRAADLIVFEEDKVAR